MRRKFLLAPALTLAFLAAAGRATAQAPTQDQNYMADSWFTQAGSNDSATVEERRLVSHSAAALVAAENLYYLKNGRYTARMQDLADWAPSKDVSMFVTAGSTWLMVRAYSLSKKEFNVLAWRGDGPRVESGHFSKPLSTGMR
jgi:hypothetical protein